MTERPEPPIPTTGIPPTWTEDQWRVYGWEYFSKHPERHPLWGRQFGEEGVSNPPMEPQSTGKPPRPSGLPSSSDSESDVVGGEVMPPRPSSLPPAQQGFSNPIPSIPRPPGLPVVEHHSEPERESKPSSIISGFKEGIAQLRTHGETGEEETEEEEEPIGVLQLLSTMVFAVPITAFAYFFLWLLGEAIGLGLIVIGVSVILDERQGGGMKALASIAVLEGLICFIVGVYGDLQGESMWGGNPITDATTDDILGCCMIGAVFFIGILIKIWWEMRKNPTQLDNQ